MLIGLVSDTHDDVASAEEAIEAMSALVVGRILHAGDFHRPRIAGLFARCGIPVDAVFGNCDSDLDSIAVLLPGACRGSREIELGNLTALLVHDLSSVADEGIAKVRLVVHGHTHAPEIRSMGPALIVNPGECCGARTGVRTFAVLDGDTMDVRIVDF